jgi:hypothetical protein
VTVAKARKTAQKVETDNRCLSIEIGRDLLSTYVFHFDMCVRRLAPRTTSADTKNRSCKPDEQCIVPLRVTEACNDMFGYISVRTLSKRIMCMK